MLAECSRCRLAPLLVVAFVMFASRVGHTAACPASAELDNKVRLWISPLVAKPGAPISVVATTTTGTLPKDATLMMDGVPLSQTAGNFWRSTRLAKLPANARQLTLSSQGRTLACHKLGGHQSKPVPPRVGAWTTAGTWNAHLEAYYSAWIDRLFDAPSETTLTFRPLAPALADPERNLLWNHLALAEDTGGSKSALRAEPDCADLPYFLRAYFAWKLALPFGFHECDRGTATTPPRCSKFHSNEDPIKAATSLAAFKTFLNILVNKAHSGSMRTGLNDDETDFYPVPLNREALRPGTIFADPYGHVLVLARWVDRDKQPGLLFAVDGQPDATITRKRFWEGNFLFASDVPSAGAGFKAYRPLRMQVDEAKAVTLNPVANAAITAPPQSFDASQAKLSPDAFYTQMFRLINPQGLDAATAYDDTLAALVEQLEARVRSVDNGEAFMKSTGNASIAMPNRARIFEAEGAWEDYATPSRDMRLLIAMRVLLDLPTKITAHPELFALSGKTASQVRNELEERHRTATRQRKIAYSNSAGQVVELTVADILNRKKALEMAYNPNDCVEIRWGADVNSAEAKTCTRHAPADQRERMEAVRSWFARMRRPTRD
ncbi:MAG: hypothetical protein SF187_09225 [Deltaproteobacteria bacterium]|nr:hypothetical protein [Deltaproteobacteria bacterium]